MEVLLMLGWIFVGLLWLSALLIVWFKAPPVPSFRRAVEEGLTAANVKPAELVMDLGAGDGRVLQIARDSYQAKIVGWELHPLMWCLAKARLGRRADVRLANFWQAPVEQADVVFTFLMPSLMGRVEREIWGKMKPGARLVSNSFPLPSQPPVAQRGSVYIYVRPGSII